MVKQLNLNIDPKTARSRISRKKSRLTTIDDAPVKPSKSVDQQEFAQLFEAYEAALASSDLLDYDDLLLRCVKLLRQHPQCVSNIEAVLIDEFQDTNLVQFELMNCLAQRNKRITIVGDPDQSIYGFRSAETKNLGRMQDEYQNTSVALLEENYRSTGAILASAEEVIGQDTARPTKRLRPTKSFGTLPALRLLPSAAAEGQWIVTEIKRAMTLTGNVLCYSDFAVLLRSASLSRQIESAMGREGIPYRMVGGLRFFDRVEVKILLDYLRVMGHPDNNDALARIINVPPRKIGDQTLKRLREEAAVSGVSLWAFIKDVTRGDRAAKKKLAKAVELSLAGFVSLISTCRNKLEAAETKCTPKTLLEHVIRKLSFDNYLEKTYAEDHENRWANVEELLAQAEDTKTTFHTASNGQEDEVLPEVEGVEQRGLGGAEESLARFLANVALSTELQSGDDDTQKEKVTISTIHAAKGLEWPVVFVPAIYDGSIPHSRAEDTDEERRLLYVAMTRAKALLYLICPRRDSRNQDNTTLSSFVSSKKVLRHFHDIAPSLTDKQVQSIARVLDRPSPSRDLILQGKEKLQSAEDDLWPANGDERTESTKYWDKSDAATFQPKFKKVCKEQVGTVSTFEAPESTYTMNNLPLMSSFGTSYSAGFASASHHMKSIPDASLDPHAARSGVATSKGKSNETNRKVSNMQGSLTKFFTQGSFGVIKSTSRAEKDPDLQLAIKASLESEAEGQAPTLPLCPPKTHSNIPEGLSSHSVQTTTALKRPRPPLEDVSNTPAYVFLSSSPTRPTSANGSVMKQGSDSLAERKVEQDGKMSRYVSNTQPSAAMHMTSMDQIRYSGVGGPAQVPTRKTLGVRRSMKGWESRMGKRPG